MPSVTFWLVAPRRSVSVRVVGLEAGKLDVHRHLTGRHGRQGDHAAVVGHRRHRLSTGGRDDDRRVRNAGAGLIHDHQTQHGLIGLVGGGLAAGLRRQRQRGQPARPTRASEAPFHLVNVFALRFGLIR